MFTRYILLFLYALIPLQADPINDAFFSLENAPYGFCFVDVGITESDLAACSALDLTHERFFHHFGDFANLEEDMAKFLTEIGTNSIALADKIAARLTEITQLVMGASERETAWVHLRASIPTSEYDIPRWHIDGTYYRTPDLKYKFAMTCLGAPTLFYRMPSELRPLGIKKMRDRLFMQSFCTPDLIETPALGQGALFIGGSTAKAAFHSEPPIHEKRLFFSIIPCHESQLEDLKKRILSTYPSNP